MESATQTKSFSKNLAKLMIPLAIMQFFNAGLALVDNIFIGQLGEVSVAAVSVAYQIYFIISLIYFGINSGSVIFTAQYWGSQDIHNIRRVVVLNVIINAIVGVIFTLTAELIPEKLISLYSSDPAVIELGAKYLQIYAIGYIVFGFSQAFYGILRSTERVRVPMTINSITLIVNTILGYCLIFGKAGFPKMDTLGAATANCTARILETIVLIAFLLLTRSILIRDIREIFPIPTAFITRFFRTAMPVVINEVMWSVGITMYGSIYAHINTEAMAATTISSTLENLAFVPFQALCIACAVMVGNRIGADEFPLAKLYARKTLNIALCLGVLMGMIMFLSKDFFLEFYKFADTTRASASLIITILSVCLVIKSWNMMMFVGILRAGGDTRFALILEICTLWLYGVPFAWIGANLFHLPIHMVVAIVLSEELFKAIVVFFRYRSSRWIHQLSKPHPTQS
jgi:putative MATE family efflux protein